MLLSKLEEAEEGERAALLEAARIKGDNEGLKVSQSDSHLLGLKIGIAVHAVFEPQSIWGQVCRGE